jgi:hypothetical protein
VAARQCATAWQASHLTVETVRTGAIVPARGGKAGGRRHDMRYDSTGGCIDTRRAIRPAIANPDHPALESWRGNCLHAPDCLESPLDFPFE